MKKILLATALVSLVSIDHCAIAVPPSVGMDDLGATRSLRARPDIDLMGWGQDLKGELSGLAQAKPVSSKLAVHEILGDIDLERGVKGPKGFEMVPDENEPVVFANRGAMLRYFEDLQAERKRQKRIDSGEIVLPSDPHYNWKVAKKAAFAVAQPLWEVASPLLGAAAVRIAGDVALKYAAPYLARGAGNAAAAAASKLNNWWTQFDFTGTADTFVRGAASATAEGEFYRDAGTMMGYVEKYGYPVARSAYQATAHLVSGAKSAATSLIKGTKAAVSRFTSWWSGTSTAASAA